MTRSSELHSLYLWFDRLMDLSEADQTAELRSLREAGNPLALQLEGMLQFHRQQSPTESPFTIEELLSVIEPDKPLQLASDLRELSKRLHWSRGHACFHLGNFSLLECLSVSAIGANYRAHDQELERDVVLLLVFPRWSRETLVHGRTLESSRAVAKVFHPHVATILGTQQLDGVFAVVRQWIPGENLGQWLDPSRGAMLQKVSLLGRGIALGLQAIHDQGVLHGDLKPSNIIMKEGKLHPVITDFGTATWIAQDQATVWQGGTRGFVAPEILRGEPPSPQSDLYSLGVILQWMATGVIAQTASTDDWNRSIATLVPSPNDAESQRTVDEFREWLQSLLADDPTQRPNDAKSVAAQLSRWTESDLDEANQDLTFKRSHGGTRPLLWDRLQSRRAWLGHAIGLGATAVASSLGGYSLANNRTKKEPVFIPGFEAHFSENVKTTIDLRLSNLQFLPNVQWGADEHPQRSDMLSPSKQGQWGWCLLFPIEVPFVPQAGLLRFDLVYDCDPGSAHYRVEYRSKESGPWKLLAEGTNFYGGLYVRTVDLNLPPQLLEDSKKFQLRVGMMFDRPARFSTTSPPIAITTGSTESIHEVGSILLWKSIYAKSDNAGVSQGS